MSFYLKHHTRETKKRISNSMKGNKNPMWGKHRSKKTREKMSKAKFKNPSRYWLGKSLSKEIKDKISKTLKGINTSSMSKEGLNRLRESKRGEGNPQWRGGISNNPYPIDWTSTLKRSIRQRDGYTCQICGKEPAIHVHHIDYDKKNCDPNNLIILCLNCHTKTNTNRKYWIKYFSER